MSDQSPLNQLPPPRVINSRMGQLYRELALLRRLKRLAQAAKEEKADSQGDGREVTRV